MTDTDNTEDVDQADTPAEEEGVDDTATPDTEGTEPEPDTFPRSYVEELRQENGKYRQRAQAGEVYAQRLHTELVRATGRLADPTDLPFESEHLEDADKLAAAVDELLARKPHLANRRPMGDIGQGASPSVGTVDLAAILRQQAN